MSFIRTHSGLMLALAAIAALMTLRIIGFWQGAVISVDPDDIMRLVSAHDVLAGQAITDASQYRDNVPFGSSLHWSHLVDIPIAGLLALGKGLGAEGADRLASAAWPSLLLGGLLALSVQLCQRLVGRDGLVAALIAPLLSLPVLTEFAPGRVDHHNLQILLTGGMALALMAGRTQPVAAAAAGLLAALSLTIGMETAPLVALAVIIVGWWSVVAPGQHARSIMGFALGLSGGLMGLLWTAYPPALLGSTACDALSVVHVAAGVAASAGLVAGEQLGRGMAAAWMRLLVMAGMGAIAIGLVVLAFPHCLAGPYGQLDPVLGERILPVIPEAQPIWRVLADEPATGLALLIVPILALVVALWAGWRCKVRRADWLVLALLLAGAIVVGVVQLRGLRLTALLAVPPGVLLATLVWRRFRERQSIAAAVMVLLAWLAVAAPVHLMLLRPLDRLVARSVPAGGGVGEAACLQRGNFAVLAGLAPGPVLAQRRLGAPILLFTRHSVVATGYHRNPAGLIDVEAFLEAGPDAALEVVQRRGIGHVAICQGFPLGPQFIAGQRSEPWDWLEPISPEDAPIQVYRVKP